MAMRVLLTVILALLSRPLQAEHAPSQPLANPPSNSHSRGVLPVSAYSAEDLVARLRSGGFLNDDSPLFDLKDPRIMDAYDQAVKRTSPHAVFRDTSSWEEIEGAVSEHLKKHGPGALVVISGAAPHIYGAIPRLENAEAVRYISATPIKASVADFQRDRGSSQISEAAALADIEIQLGRTIGVLKTIGYDDIQSFLTDRAKVRGAKNIIVGVEEAGFHSVYSRGLWEDKAAVYDALKEFVERAKPTSVLYLEEALDVAEKQADFAEPGMKRFLKNERWQKKELGFPRRPWDDFLIDAKNKGVPLAFAAFGIRDDNQPDLEFEKLMRQTQEAFQEMMRLKIKLSRLRVEELERMGVRIGELTEAHLKGDKGAQKAAMELVARIPQLVAEDSSSLPVLTAAACLLIDMGDFILAETYLKTAMGEWNLEVVSQPGMRVWSRRDGSKAYSVKASLMNQRKDHKSAMNAATEALRLDPKNAQAYFERGKANAGLKAFAEARKDYKRADELDSRHYAYMDYYELYRTAARELGKHREEEERMKAANPPAVTRLRAFMDKVQDSNAKLFFQGAGLLLILGLILGNNPRPKT